MTWMALNMNNTQAEQLRQDMLAAHSDCSSAIGTWTKCNTVYTTSWDLTKDEINARWEPMVESQR